mgnify:CR=1 FL=1
MKKIVTTVLISIVSLTGVFAQEIYENDYEWKIPGGEYVNPVSFFSMHGYVNAVFANASEEWTSGNFNGIGMPGQLIAPNTNKSSFTNDEALWISSELNQQTSLVMEMHLVTDPSNSGAAGPGALTFALTEANVKIKLYKNWLNVAAGTFWSPFGIQSRDWLGAQNLFTLLPLASGAYITHYNERGIRVDGYYEKDKFGINYVLSVGNGFNAYDIMGWKGVDLNDNKAINGRVSIFPGMGKDLNIGFSGSFSQLHEASGQLPATSKIGRAHV